MPQWRDVTASMSNLTLSPTGKRIAVEARGEIFTIPAEKGDVRDITNASASAEHEPAWSPDGKMISYFSDRSGEYSLYIQSQDGLTRAARDQDSDEGPLLYGRRGRPMASAFSSTTPISSCGSSTSRRGRRKSSATIRGWCRRAR